MIVRDDLPDTPEWTCDPRVCPFDTCRVCESDQQTIWLHRSDNVILGEN